VTLHTMNLLLVRPYIFPSDDLLHLQSQIIILLLLCAGWVFYYMDTIALSGQDDWVMSIALLLITVAFFGLFLYFAALQFYKWIRKLYKKHCKKTPKDAAVMPAGTAARTDGGATDDKHKDTAGDGANDDHGDDDHDDVDDDVEEEDEGDDDDDRRSPVHRGRRPNDGGGGDMTQEPHDADPDGNAMDDKHSHLPGTANDGADHPHTDSGTHRPPGPTTSAANGHAPPSLDDAARHSASRSSQKQQPVQHPSTTTAAAHAPSSATAPASDVEMTSVLPSSEAAPL